MSYAIKYTAEIKDYFNDTFKVDILERGYSGSATEIFFMADTPLELNYPGDEMDVFRPLYGSQLIISAISETDFKYVSLHTADGRKYRVNLYKNDVLYWTGWLIPDLYTEPYTAAPYMVQITARCGLGELDSIKMPQTVASYVDGDSVVKGKSFVNLYSAITHCLRSLNLGIDIKEAINIYNSERTTPPVDTDTTLTDAYVDLRNYEGFTMYEFLDSELRAFGARLYQQDGFWQIIRLSEYREALKLRTLDINGGSTQSYDDTKLTTFLIGKPQQNYILNSSPEMKINPGWKSFDINYKRDKYISILKNYDFSETVVLNTVYSGTYSNTPRITLTPDDWIRSGRISADRMGVCYIEENKNGNWFKYIYQDFNLEAAKNQALRVEIECAPIARSYTSPGVVGIIPNGAGSKTEFAFGLNMTDNSDVKFAEYTNFGFGKWGDTINNVIVVPDVTVVGVQEKQFSTHTVIFREIPLTGRVRFAVFGAQNFELAVKSIKITLIEILNPDDPDPRLILSEYQDKENEQVTVSDNNSYIGRDVEIYGADLPDIPNAGSIWKYGYKDVAGNRTRIWKNKDETTEKALIEHLKDQYRQMYILPQWVLSLPILSRDIKFDSSIVDYQVINKKYQCVSCSIDLRAAIFNGVFAEIGAWEGSEWILEDGSWNDDGIWIDSKLWNDE
jgi:hypothetical protein